MNARKSFDYVTGKPPIYFSIWVLTFRGVKPSIRKNNLVLTRWIVVSHQIIIDMFYCIMKKNGTPIAEKSLQHVTRDCMLDADISKLIMQFNNGLVTCIDEVNFLIPLVRGFIRYKIWINWKRIFTSRRRKYWFLWQINWYKGSARLEKNGGGYIVMLKRRVTTINCIPIFVSHNNPILDSRQYII